MLLLFIHTLYPWLFRCVCTGPKSVSDTDLSTIRDGQTQCSGRDRRLAPPLALIDSIGTSTAGGVSKPQGVTCTLHLHLHLYLVPCTFLPSSLRTLTSSTRGISISNKPNSLQLSVRPAYHQLFAADLWREDGPGPHLLLGRQVATLSCSQSYLTFPLTSHSSLSPPPDRA
jgi:hypothetical protein